MEGDEGQPSSTRTQGVHACPSWCTLQGAESVSKAVGKIWGEVRKKYKRKKSTVQLGEENARKREVLW